MNSINFADVSKYYGPVTALHDVTLTLDLGTVHALAGANGSGKTTILRLTAGLTNPSAGTVTTPDTKIGYAFQQPNIYPALSVNENIAVFGRLTNASQDWISNILETLRLTRVAHRPAEELSDGYQKKLDLALALAAKPPIVLLDEPLADVDDITRSQFIDLLETYRAPDRLIVVATHNIDQFATVIDHLTLLHDGELVDSAHTTDPIATYTTFLDDLEQPTESTRG